jgi:regulator of chromosome condensation
MGLTTEGNKKSPVEVSPGLVAVDIASGNDHLVILAQNGKVFTIGCAEQGQLGRITARTLTGESRRGTKTLLTPGMIPKKAGKFVASAIWATPFCTFLREQSTDLIYGFGLNNYNQLGVEKTGKEFEHFPVLSQFKNVKSIAGGQHHTIVLTNDNKVHAIGRRDYGRLGLGEVKDDVQKLTPIGSLQKIDILDINCGDCNTLAITKDGKIYVWGLGTNSQLGTGGDDDVLEPTLLTGAQVKEKNAISVSSGGQHSLFIVEVPELIVKATKAKPVEAAASVVSSNGSEAAPKENGTAAKPSTKNSKKTAPVIMESDSTTDVNGNSEKDEKMEVDTTEAKRSRKRKA